MFSIFKQSPVDGQWIPLYLNSESFTTVNFDSVEPAYDFVAVKSLKNNPDLIADKMLSGRKYYLAKLWDERLMFLFGKIDRSDHSVHFEFMEYDDYDENLGYLPVILYFPEKRIYDENENYSFNLLLDASQPLYFRPLFNFNDDVVGVKMQNGGHVAVVGEEKTCEKCEGSCFGICPEPNQVCSKLGSQYRCVSLPPAKMSKIDILKISVLVIAILLLLFIIYQRLSLP